MTESIVLCKLYRNYHENCPKRSCFLSFSVTKGNEELLCLEKQKELNHTLRLGKTQLNAERFVRGEEFMFQPRGKQMEKSD